MNKTNRQPELYAVAVAVAVAVPICFRCHLQDMLNATTPTWRLIELWCAAILALSCIDDVAQLYVQMPYLKKKVKSFLNARERFLLVASQQERFFI